MLSASAADSPGAAGWETVIALASGGAAMMPRYFFNFLDGRNIRDSVGSEHPSLGSVREEAVEVLTQILKGRILQDEDMSTVMVQVTDEQNSTVLIVSLLAAVRLIGDSPLPPTADR